MAMAMTPSGVSAVLLAAGESRRMGAFKQLLRINDSTFVERCVDTLLSSKVDEVVVVTGHRSEEVKSALGERRVRFAHNDQYQLGMSSSIVKGVSELSPTVRACLIALADQPLIPVNVIDSLIEAFQNRGGLILIPRFQGRRGHPVIIDLSLKNELARIDPAQGLREMVNKHLSETTMVDVSTESILLDFDFPRDYETIARFS
jgi:molybdenum cofactor cytidylyltransferase